MQQVHVDCLPSRVDNGFSFQQHKRTYKLSSAYKIASSIITSYMYM